MIIQNHYNIFRQFNIFTSSVKYNLDRIINSNYYMANRIVKENNVWIVYYITWTRLGADGSFSQNKWRFLLVKNYHIINVAGFTLIVEKCFTQILWLQKSHTKNVRWSSKFHTKFFWKNQWYIFTWSDIFW